MNADIGPKRNRKGIVWLAGALVIAAAWAGTARATDVGAASNASGGFGDGIINFNVTGTLTMDQDLTGIHTITVANSVTGTIAFAATAFQINFADQDSVITLGTASGLTITGSGATAGFDFATTPAGKILTITSSSADSLGDAVAANRILLGSTNTLRIASSGNPNALRTVVVSGTPTIDANANVTIDTVTVTSGDDVDVDIADSTTVTVTNAVTLAGDSVLELIAVAGGSAETLALTGGLSLGGTSHLRFTNDSGAVTGTVTANSDTAIINADGSATLADLNLSSSLDIQIASGKTLTLTDAVTVPTTEVLSVTGTNDGSAETLVATGGIALDGNNAELHLLGDATTAMVLTGTVTVSENNGILDVDQSASITAVTLVDDEGDLELQVAAGKTLTTTVNVNANVLTLAETGTVSTVSLDDADSVVNAEESATITTLTHTGSAIQLGNGKTLTITNAVSVSAGKLTVTGSGGGAQDHLNATISLDAATSELEFTGDDADNITGTVIRANQNGPTIDTDIDIDPTSITLVSSSGDLTFEVATGKTVSSTVTVNNNVLTLTQTGDPGTIQLNHEDGVLNVDASVEPTDVSLSSNATVDIASGQTLTADLDVGARTLTLAGGGTLTSAIVTTGSIIANGTTTLTTLTANPGAGQTFTYTGTGNSKVTTFTAFDAAGETFEKEGSGSLTVTNGFGFGGTTGVKLSVAAGEFIDAGGTAIDFGDDGERITVADGATYTTSSSIRGDSGNGTNLDAAEGSTVNFAGDDTQTLTADADDDFQFLGTVNVRDGAELALAGAFTTSFADVNVQDGGTFTNNEPNSTMLFVPNAMLVLFGDAALDINGQSASSRITVSTTTGGGSFTLDRGASPNMTFRNVALSRSTYTSDAGGSADGEVMLAGVSDEGGNVNWFTSLVADAGPDKQITAGSTATLDGSATGASGTYTFSWEPQTGLDDPASARPAASPTATTTYTLTVADSANTALTDTDDVTVTVIPAVSVDAGPDAEISSGDSTTLTGTVSGGIGPFTAAWTPDTGLSSASSLTPTASPEETTTYTLTVTDTGDANRMATDQVTVTVTGGGGGLFGCAPGVLGVVPVAILGLIGIKRRHRTIG